MFLTALDGGPDITVGRFPVIVGRHPLCDAWLDSLRVSRRHCTLVEIDGQILVRDLGSSNGTRINGRRIESGWLRSGDEFTVAHLRFRVSDGRDRSGPSGGTDVETIAPSPRV